MLKNIVVFNDNARITGGADKVALGSAVGLARRGYHVDLLTATTPIAPELLSVPRLTVHSTDQYEILHDQIGCGPRHRDCGISRAIALRAVCWMACGRKTPSFTCICGPKRSLRV